MKQSRKNLKDMDWINRMKKKEKWFQIALNTVYEKCRKKNNLMYNRNWISKQIDVNLYTIEK